MGGQPSEQFDRSFISCLGRSSSLFLSVALAAFLFICGCSAREQAAPPPPPVVEENTHGPIRVTLTADPGRVELDKDILLTIRVVSPSEMDVALPSLEDRLQGFTLAGSYSDEPATREGTTTLAYHARLTPLLADRYRIAPMPIQYMDKGPSPPVTGWFATRPIVLEVVQPFEGSPPGDITTEPSALWIRPPARTILLYVAAALAVAALVAVAVKLLGRIREQVQLMRMSPRERALKELARLLARDLIAKDLVKDFYVELTMIVRRYIERAHLVRAPEQTTEEFLEAVASDARFPGTVVATLRDFLEAADLVKFAAHRPTGEAVANATDTARRYVETDSGTTGNVKA